MTTQTAINTATNTVTFYGDDWGWWVRCTSPTGEVLHEFMHDKNYAPTDEEESEYIKQLS